MEVNTLVGMRFWDDGSRGQGWSRCHSFGLCEYVNGKRFVCKAAAGVSCSMI